MSSAKLHCSDCDWFCPHLGKCAQTDKPRIGRNIACPRFEEKGSFIRSLEEGDA